MFWVEAVAPLSFGVNRLEKKHWHSYDYDVKPAAVASHDTTPQRIQVIVAQYPADGRLRAIPLTFAKGPNLTRTSATIRRTP